jgi:hypothetical protein
LRRVHLFSALLSFEKGGKLVVNLPMEWVFSFSAEVSTRTSNSCAAIHVNNGKSQGGTNDTQMSWVCIARPIANENLN